MESGIRRAQSLSEVCLLILLGIGLYNCGSSSSLKIKCDSATGNSSLVQGACGTSSTAQTTTLYSPVPSPYPTPSPTITPCSYSTTWTMATVSDPTLAFAAETNDFYSSTITASTCVGFTVGTTQNLVSTSIDSDGTTVNVTPVATALAFTLSGTSLTLTPAPTPNCVGTTIESTTLGSGTVSNSPSNQIILNWTYQFTPNGC